MKPWYQFWKTRDVPSESGYIGFIEREDFAGAIPLLKQACIREDPAAMGILATFLALGKGIDKNPDEAILWYRQAAVRGHTASQAALGFSLMAGIGCTPDRREAAYWLFKAASMGHRKAAIGLGDLVFQDQSLVTMGLFTAKQVNELVIAAHHFKTTL